MITIAKYSSLESAQKDADLIASRGIEVTVSQGEFVGIISGNQPSFQLQVYEEDINKLESIRDEIWDDLRKDNAHSCPSCGKNNYAPYRSKIKNIADIIDVLKEQLHFSSYNHYKCRDCTTTFKVKL